MAKPTETTKTTVVRVERAVGPDGKPIPGAWNCVEVTITGTATRKTLEERKPLAICRDTWRRLMQERLASNPEEQPW